jgi:hypothetical protein
MHRSVGSPLARHVMVGLALIPIWPVSAAHAMSCGERIAKLEVELRQAEADRRVLSAPQSTSAMLHHQPTPESIAKAKTEVQEHLVSRLDAAKKLNSEGKESECLAALGRFAVDIGSNASR